MWTWARNSVLQNIQNPKLGEHCNIKDHQQPHWCWSISSWEPCPAWISIPGNASSSCEGFLSQSCVWESPLVSQPNSKVQNSSYQPPSLRNSIRPTRWIAGLHISISWFCHMSAENVRSHQPETRPFRMIPLMTHHFSDVAVRSASFRIICNYSFRLNSSFVQKCSGL